MSIEKSKLEKLSYGLMGYSGAVEFEKVGLNWILREQLNEPYNWPLIMGQIFYLA